MQDRSDNPILPMVRLPQEPVRDLVGMVRRYFPSTPRARSTAPARRVRARAECGRRRRETRSSRSSSSGDSEGEPSEPREAVLPEVAGGER